jgi:hypothetical protein
LLIQQAGLVIAEDDRDQPETPCDPGGESEAFESQVVR